MTTPTLRELSTFLGREPRTAHIIDPVRGPQEQFEFTLSVAGASVIWRVSPALGHCEFFGLSGTDSPIEAFVKCDAIVINTDIEEEGGQCIVMKADGWHVCLTPGSPDRLFFDLRARPPSVTAMKEKPNKAPEPTPLRVTPRAYARVAPLRVVARL